MKNNFLKAVLAATFFVIPIFAMEKIEKEKLAQEYLTGMGFENEATQSYESLQIYVAKKNPVSGEQMKTPELSAQYKKDLNQALIDAVVAAFPEEDLKKTVNLLTKTSYGKALTAGHRRFLDTYMENINKAMEEIRKKGLAGDHK